jgi:membrane protein implicated in regulation of membrane protease activity
MPLDRFVLILVAVIGAAGATVWTAATLMAAAVAPVWALLSLIPAGLVAYILVRVVAERRHEAADDRYDRIER